MLKFDKILKILTIAIFVVTLVLLGLLFFGGDVPNQLYKTPVYTGELLGWAYILFFICAGLSLIFPLFNLVTNPQKAIKSIVGIVALVVIVLISYSLSDGTPLVMAGYDGSQNVPSMLKFSDTMIYMMYILGAGAILAIIVTEVIRKIR